jgi:hypothetical protein
MLWLYAVILVAAALGLWGVYRILGTPTRLSPVDYRIVLADITSSVGRSAGRLRAALEGDADRLDEVAADSRKIFQTGYYQTLRMRPETGSDAAVEVRAALARACEAYDWASRMLGSESRRNPLVLAAARALLDAGEAALTQVERELPQAPALARESPAPSP